MDNIITALKSEISSHGMTPPDQIEAGKIIRFSDNGDKNKNGWCILYLNPDGSAGAAFGNWKGLEQKWFYTPDGKPLSKEQQQDFSEQIQQAREKADQELKKKQSQAAIKANEIWENAQPANPEHEYLVKKQIKPYGSIKQSGEKLLIPVFANPQQITSLQEIYPNGSKRFMPGGKIQGCYCLFRSTSPNKYMYIGEGFATMASVHAATGALCIVAFNSGNLQRVAEIFRSLYPNGKIIICADNDLDTEKKTGTNPGRKAAEEAAGAIGAYLCISPVNSDFNDYYVSKGINATQQALKKTRKFEKDIMEPLPLERELEKSEPYPLKALGEIIGAAADIMNKAIQAPDGLCAHAVLGFATHAVQGHANVIIDGRIIPLNEFYLSIGSRSARKSECDSKAGYVHKEIQKALLNQHKADRKAFQDEQDAYKTEKEKILREKKKSLSEKNEALAELRKQEPKAPHEPLIMFSDPTTQGIHGLFLNGTPSKYLCADEGGQVSGGHSMKAEEKTYTATTFSKWWDGAPIDRVRGGDGSSVLYGRRLSMHLMMQDKIAAEFFNDDVLRNQGYMSRNLIIYPESLAGQRHYQSYNVADTPEMKKFYEQVQKILETPLPLKIDEDSGLTINELEPRIIYLENDAKTAWVNAYEAIESESGKDRKFESIEGFAGKASNHIIRLAGIMALFDDINRKSIPKRYINNAVELMEYYLNERLRLTKMAEPNHGIEQAKTLLKWIQKKGLKVITLPDVYQLGPSRFRNKQQAQDSIGILINHFWLSMIDGGGISEITGKKSNNIWSINHGKI